MRITVDILDIQLTLVSAGKGSVRFDHLRQELPHPVENWEVGYPSMPGVFCGDHVRSVGGSLGPGVEAPAVSLVGAGDSNGMGDLSPA
jgi:hypothetical protein